MVQVPKVPLTVASADPMELRCRYNNLYIPSDFFISKPRWFESFPAESPYSLKQPCSFHVMHKDTEYIGEELPASSDPADADYLFSAKVMLMGIPPTSELYQKCFATAEDLQLDEDKSYVHPSRLITFLVGNRGKHETMAIGGPWSRSLDGEDPLNDPTVLIRTAIRTCKALTGIDLSKCSQWWVLPKCFWNSKVLKGEKLIRPLMAIRSLQKWLVDVVGRWCPELLVLYGGQLVVVSEMTRFFIFANPISFPDPIFHCS